MRVRQRTAKLWYNYLQIAIQQGVPIDWTKYPGWGNEKQIATTSFNRWWKERGRDLFNLNEEAPKAVRVVPRMDSSVVTVKIPLDMRIDDIKKAVSAIVLKARTKKRIGLEGRFKLTGQDNYSTLVQYKRFLEIEFGPRFHGKTVEEKTEALKKVYESLAKKGKRQRQTLRKQGRHSAAKRFSNREVEDFDRKKLGGISPKRVSRWRLSGKHIILNVAVGAFPGEDYYGARLKDRLQQKLKTVGLADVGGVQRARGGRKKKPKLKRQAGLAEHSLSLPSWKH